MKHHILLVNTNRLRPAVGPIGLDYAADTLCQYGFEPMLLDLCFEADLQRAIAVVLDDLEPLLIGLTLRNTDDCYLASGEDFIPSFSEIVEIIRRHTQAPIVGGGGGYSIFPESLLRTTDLDYGIVADGEVALAELASALSGRTGELAAVPGLVWEENGKVRRNAPWFDPPAALPERRRAFVDNERYFREGGQCGIETKRGCDRQCIYCADPVIKGSSVRMRTPKQVVEEFETLLGRGIDHFHLCDSEFNVPVEHAFAVCEEMRRCRLGERARWYTYATPAGFSTELALLMREAGCVGVNFGADSADDGMLHRLGRDFQVTDLLETASACRKAGIVFMYDLLLGGPGETPESVARTIDLMKQISPDRIGVSLGVRVYAGTRLDQLVRQEAPLKDNSNLRGAVDENDDFLKPLFYLCVALGDDAASYVASLVGGDERFFFPTEEAGTTAYNYSDNDRLVEAIQQGYRGAYWDILRRLATAH